MNPAKTMIIEVGTFNKLCDERRQLRKALGDMLNLDIEGVPTVDAIDRALDILTRTQEG